MSQVYLELIPYLKTQSTPKDFEELLALLPNLSKWTPFYQEHFETLIYKLNNKVHFLIRTPSLYKKEIIQILYAKYHNLQIRPFQINQAFKWINLKASNSKLDQELKSYQLFNQSPLNPVLNSLQNNEILKIQFRHTNKTSKQEVPSPLKKCKISLGYQTNPPFKLLNSLQQFDSQKALIPSQFNNTIYLSHQELATIFHLPTQNCNFEKLNYSASKTIAPPQNLSQANSVLAKTNHRQSNKLFGLSQEDRRRHLYLIGKTGMGKSTLVENLIISNLQQGQGLALIDPHGDLYQSILNKIPKNRSNDIILFDPFDQDFPISFNPLQEKNYKHLSISGLVSTFKKLFSHSWGPRLEYVLRNSLLTLAEHPNTSLLSLPRLLTDTKYRLQLTKNLQDPILHKFWQNEFNNLTEKQRQETIAPILNKVGQFFSSPICRNILSQSQNKLDLKFAMDTQKIILINLSKGQLGEDISQLLGSLLITKFQIDAMSRVNQPESKRKDFYLYIDEFQNFATESFISILSEARKYRLNLTIANQYLDQILPEIKDAIFGNIGSLISFQVGSKDAQYLSQELSNQVEISAHDLQNLSKYHIYLKILQNGIPSKSFSANSLPPAPLSYPRANSKTLIQLSRTRYTQKKHIIEQNIQNWNKN